jgi:phosphoribosylanthranilate isomerase
VSAGLKICGITRAEDLAACEELAVPAVGLNFWSGSKRHLSLEAARVLLDGRRKGALRVGVFVDPSLDELRAVWDTLDLDYVQLHGDAPIKSYADMQIPYVWVLRGTPDLGALTLPEPRPRWVLLDAAVDGYGGAGRQTDWSWARDAVLKLAPLEVWLAGGITPDNAAEALEAVNPAGLDVASGAESSTATSGEKDRTKIASLARICQNHRSP